MRVPGLSATNTQALWTLGASVLVLVAVSAGAVEPTNEQLAAYREAQKAAVERLIVDLRRRIAESSSRIEVEVAQRTTEADRAATREMLEERTEWEVTRLGRLEAGRELPPAELYRGEPLRVGLMGTLPRRYIDGPDGVATSAFHWEVEQVIGPETMLIVERTETLRKSALDEQEWSRTRPRAQEPNRLWVEGVHRKGYTRGDAVGDRLCDSFSTTVFLVTGTRRISATATAFKVEPVPVAAFFAALDAIPSERPE